MKSFTPENKIPLFKVFMAPSASERISKVLNSGYIGQGELVEEFENKLKGFFNVDYLSTVNSGTSALHLAIHLLKKPVGTNKVYDGAIGYSTYWPGLEPGDEVLTTAMTCTASNWPILANGLRIKWVDINPRTLNLDLDDLERKLSPKTKIIMAVHWGGYPNDLDRLKELQNRCYQLYGFKPAIIEDGAHSFGSKYKGGLIGSHGNFTMFSLQAIKHITSIDGGILISPHSELNRRARLLRWYGIDRDSDRKDFRCEADIEEWGFKFHMNDVNASVGLENLKHADMIISKHKENASFYDESLSKVSGVELLERNPDFESSFWIYSLKVENRPDFYKWMDECKIAVSQVHERNDKHNCSHEYRSFLPNLDKTIDKIVSIPVGWWITKEQREYISDCIQKGW